MTGRCYTLALLLPFLAGGFVRLDGAAAANLASDAASDSAYAGETGGAWKGLNSSADENPPGADDGGIGFNAWDFSGGFHYPNQSPYGRLNHFIDGVDFEHSTSNNLGAPAFGLTNANVVQGGATSSARRSFEAPLAIGNTVSLRFDNPLLTPLHAQAPSALIIRLNSGSGDQTLEQFAMFATSDFNGGVWAASDLDGVNTLSLATSATSEGAEFRFTLTNAETYLIEVRPLSGGNPLASRSGNLAHPAAGLLRSLDVVMYENGSGNGLIGAAGQPTGAREFFFNNLMITSPKTVGDYDDDRDVDGSDFLNWQRTLGSTLNLAADGNNNGIVDSEDLRLWMQGFGTRPASEATALPEPAALVLAVVAICLCRARELPKWSIIRLRRQR
jgi:hypothetical protein